MTRSIPRLSFRFSFRRSGHKTADSASPLFALEQQSSSFGPLTRAEADAITSWRYEGELAFYNPPQEDAESAAVYMSDPQNGFIGVRLDNRLTGFCSLGPDGRVPGGSYDDSALDIGAGMRPDLVGLGGGAAFFQSTVGYLRHFEDRPLRVTIATWNERAIKAVQAVGFRSSDTFANPAGVEFTILVLPR